MEEGRDREKVCVCMNKRLKETGEKTVELYHSLSVCFILENQI